MISGDPDNIDQCPYNGALDALGRKGVKRALEYGTKKIFFKKVL